MTPRERLLAPFRGLTPDQPAYLPDLSYWHAAMTHLERLEPRHQGREGYLQLHREIDACCYYACGGTTFGFVSDEVESSVEETGTERLRRWRTPAGELTERWRWVEQASCWAHTEYAATSAAELRVVLEIYQGRRSEPAPGAWQAMSEFLGDDGLPISAAPRSPLPGLLTDWCGVFATCLLIADELPLVEDTLAAMAAANEGAFAAMAASEVELFHFGDNLDSHTSTPLFEPFMADYYRRHLEQLHAAGKSAVVHLDGGVRGLLPKLAEVGFDGVESITPAPVGDVATEEVRALAGGDDLILWGGVPGAMFAPPWHDEDLAAQTRHWLSEAGPLETVILGTADQVPPNGSLSGCRAVAEAIEEWAREGRGGGGERVGK